MLEGYPLCRLCLLRQYPPTLTRVLELMVARHGLNGRIGAPWRCFICRGLMESIPLLGQLILDSLKDYEFRSLGIGTIFPPDILDREDALRSEFRLKGGESIKPEFLRELGKLAAAKGSCSVGAGRPDLMAILNVADKTVSVRSSALYLYGRYLKTRRGLPQKKSKCFRCRGSGCKECDNTGLSNVVSVESVLTKKLAGHFRASTVRFTWIGGEDPESLVLGDGRPFYAEICQPRVRRLPKHFGGELGEGVFLSGARFVNGIPGSNIDFKVEVKARAIFQKEITEELLGEIEAAFHRKPVQALTKKKDRAVEKMIYHFKAERRDSLSTTLRILSDGGLNYKKLASGEGGDVNPSISSVAGCAVSLDEEMPFDVLRVIPVV